MDDALLLTAEGLSRHFGSHLAVDQLNLELRRGEVLGLLGVNGAGKSTTLRMLSGNLAPSEGRITLNGIDLLDEPKRAKAALGYLPEQPPLYRELSVEEYLGYCARLHQLPAGERPAAIDRALARCDLGDVRRRLIGNLSKGYQQRVGIAQAILHNPEVVILDEPSVGLDPQQMREIRALVRELGGEHAVILSSHILSEVEAVCDRVVIIHQGHQVLNEAIGELRRRREHGSLTLGLRRPPPPEALAALAGVVQVSTLDGGRFRIEHAAGSACAETLAVAAVEGDWGLYELIPEDQSLEEVFLGLTREQTEKPEAAA